MKAGQYWESSGALMEIVSFDQDIGVGERRWNGLGNKLMVGNRLTLNKEDIRSGGTDYYINLNELRAMSTRLATFFLKLSKLVRLCKQRPRRDF